MDYVLIGGLILAVAYSCSFVSIHDATQILIDKIVVGDKGCEFVDVQYHIKNQTPMTWRSKNGVVYLGVIESTNPTLDTDGNLSYYHKMRCSETGISMYVPESKVWTAEQYRQNNPR